MFCLPSHQRPPLPSLSLAEVQNMEYYEKQCWQLGRSQVFDTLSRTDGVLLSAAPGASSSSSVVSAGWSITSLARSITRSTVLPGALSPQQGIAILY